MTARRGFVVLLSALAGLGSARPLVALEQKTPKAAEVRAAGIVFDFNRDQHWLTIKADGEEAVVKYGYDPADPRLAEALKGVFNAARVRLIYRLDGDARRLVAIQKQVIQASGTVTGTVVAVHNAFWVELKPRKGVADAFALGPANFNDPAFVARLKALKPGDSATIQFTTDFERHRIVAIRKNAAKPASVSGATGP